MLLNRQLIFSVDRNFGSQEIKIRHHKIFQIKSLTSFFLFVFRIDLRNRKHRNGISHHLLVFKDLCSLYIIKKSLDFVYVKLFIHYYLLGFIFNLFMKIAEMISSESGISER